MHIIDVAASKPYQVLIGKDLLRKTGALVSGVVKGRRAVIVTDGNVDKLYSDICQNSLTAAGFICHKLVIPAGELSKSLKFFGDTLSFFAQSGLTRHDCAVALGGGVVGDLTGFAAASYMRGIGYVQIPTTLLSAIDSSVGGKTAVNLPQGKNLVGAFYQPNLVVTDVTLFDTLPKSEIQNGLGEGAKYAVLGGGEIWELMESGLPLSDAERFVSLCVDEKKLIVVADEKENGVRSLLNLGHTFGHAIEKLSGYTMPHGACVAEGLSIICEIGVGQGWTPPSVCERIQAMLNKNGLDGNCPFELARLAREIHLDKKADNQSITLAVVKDIGRCGLIKFPLKDIEKLI